MRFIPNIRHQESVVPDHPGIVSQATDSSGVTSIVHIRVAELQNSSGVAWVAVGQYSAVSDPVEVWRTNQPSVPVLVVGVISIVSIMMTSKVVPHLVQGGVVAIGAALLGRCQRVATTRGDSVGVATATVLVVVCQQLCSICRAPAVNGKTEYFLLIIIYS